MPLKRVRLYCGVKWPVCVSLSMQPPEGSGHFIFWRTNERTPLLCRTRRRGGRAAAAGGGEGQPVIRRGLGNGTAVRAATALRPPFFFSGSAGGGRGRSGSAATPSQQRARLRRRRPAAPTLAPPAEAPEGGASWRRRGAAPSALPLAGRAHLIRREQRGAAPPGTPHPLPLPRRAGREILTILAALLASKPPSSLSSLLLRARCERDPPTTARRCNSRRPAARASLRALSKRRGSVDDPGGKPARDP